MAKLSSFRADTAAINDGVWIRVDETLYDDLEIFSRGQTDAYVDAAAARTRKAAEPYNGDATRIPNAALREVNASLLRDFLVIDVKNLSDDAGQPVTKEAFLDLLDKPEMNRLAQACWAASRRVTSMTKVQADDALGNSDRPSATISSGAA